MTARSSLVTKRALPDRSEDKDLAVKKAAVLNGGSQPANAVDTKRTGEAEHLKRSSRLSIIRKKQEKRLPMFATTFLKRTKLWSRVHFPNIGSEKRQMITYRITTKNETL